ncbi:PDZ and LIM domain protein Zasp [Trichonephila clavipes]|nr:PDZ and LIM domain protein Zasp [Trichonephila clavipes]
MLKLQYDFNLLSATGVSKRLAQPKRQLSRAYINIFPQNISSAPFSGISTPTSPLSQNMRPALSPSDGNSFLYKPLPTTNFGSQQRQRRCSTESFTSTTSSDTEKDAITNQPYRSIPLILPGAKTSKDIPVGSYLRFDPLSKRSSTPTFGSRGDPYMLSKVQEAVMEAAHTSSNISSPGRTPTPDMGMGMFNGSQVYLRQYNSPIHMYSNQAIVEAIAEQTVHTKQPALNNVELLEKKKFTNIEQSPTYQLIQEEELRKGKIVECNAPEERVYNILPVACSSPRLVQSIGEEDFRQGNLERKLASVVLHPPFGE